MRVVVIDIRGVPGDDYWNGWYEYSLPIMHIEDWNDLGDWLESFSTFELWGVRRLNRAV